MKVKAAIADGKGNFIIDTIDVAEPQSGEVLVEIRAAGICHTDFDSLTWGRPLIMGHEGAGIVKAVGTNVEHVQPGDRVILNWAVPCGICFQCINGRQSICENRKGVPVERSLHKGIGLWRSFNIGTMSSATLVSKQAVSRIPDDISFPAAAITGCGVMTGYGSVVNIAKVGAGSSVVVIGCGGVGLNVIQGAKISGALKIIGVDVNPLRLEMARTFGATHIILASREDKMLTEASKEVRSLTDGRGADYAFECTAVPELSGSPLLMVRNAGIAVEVSGFEQDVTIDMNLFKWDKVYINPLYGGCQPERDFPRIFALYRRGDLLLDDLITRTYPLEQLELAFADMHAGKNAKGVLTFDD
jgi:S-(hydroxymethyl)glutathione dehydrogenase / alcohol dehydrogenase